MSITATADPGPLTAPGAPPRLEATPRRRRSRPGWRFWARRSAPSWPCSTSRSSTPRSPTSKARIGAGHRRWRLDLDLLPHRRDRRDPAHRLARAGRSRCAATCWSTRCCSWSSRRPAPRPHDLGQMIVLRAAQGFAGGVLIPMAFTIIITLLPKAKQPIGLALFALSATFAPAIGPTIGGYLTENWGWQYIFYVNLVPGAVMLGDAVVLARARADEARAAARGRLGRHRDHGDRPRRAADGARGRQQGRLVRLALHPPPVDRRRRRAHALRLDRAHEQEAAAQSAAAAAAEFRLRHARELSPGHRRSTAPSSSCRSISRAFRATTPSRSATCSPGPACRSSCSSRSCRG